MCRRGYKHTAKAAKSKKSVENKRVNIYVRATDLKGMLNGWNGLELNMDLHTPPYQT